MFERETEVARLRNALAGHLFDGESLSVREAVRHELILQGSQATKIVKRLLACCEALVPSYADPESEIRLAIREAQTFLDGSQ